MARAENKPFDVSWHLKDMNNRRTHDTFTAAQTVRKAAAILTKLMKIPLVWGFIIIIIFPPSSSAEWCYDNDINRVPWLSRLEWSSFSRSWERVNTWTSAFALASTKSARKSNYIFSEMRVGKGTWWRWEDRWKRPNERSCQAWGGKKRHRHTLCKKSSTTN